MKKDSAMPALPPTTSKKCLSTHLKLRRKIFAILNVEKIKVNARPNSKFN